MQPIIYKSTDAQAPQLTYEAGSMNTILKACLITGYGSKQSASWEIVHENQEAQQLAIRSKNPKSLKHVLFVADNSSVEANVIAYKTWDNQTRTGAKYHEGTIRRKFYEGSSTHAYWVLIATDHFFYLWIQAEASQQRMGVLHGFGDIYSLWQDRQYSTLIVPNSNSYYYNNVCYTQIITSNGVAVFPQGIYKSDYQQWGDRVSETISEKFTSKVAIFSRFFLYQEIRGAMQPAVELPGMLMPFSQIEGYTNRGNVHYLENQHPFIQPVIGLYQPWVGRVWFQMDNWEL